jgi:hypothetical protein
MASSSKNYNEDIHGQWRANAGEKVVYTEDFPAALLCGTEFTDNSLAKGRATRIEWTFDITNPHAGTFTITDNGAGIEKQSDLLRFLKFGSKSSSDAYHQYAWGRFRAMTAFMPDYETAEWTATFRLCGNPNNLSQISHPWSTPENMQRSMIDIPIDETNRTIGLQMVIKFDASSIFGEELANDPQKLFAKTKERLASKYTKPVFDQTEFILTVKNAAQTITENFRTKKGGGAYKQTVEELPANCCEEVFDETFQWKSIQVRVTEYRLLPFAKKKEPAPLVALRTGFPTYGTRCENSQRVHIYNDERLIESRSKPKMEGRKPDNHQNGEFVIISTSSQGGDFNDLPVSSTTKVSVKDNCENLAGIYQHYLDEKKRRIEETKAKAAKERTDRLAKEKIARAGAAAAAAPLQAAAPAAPLQAATAAAKNVAVAGGGHATNAGSTSTPTKINVKALPALPTFPSSLAPPSSLPTFPSSLAPPPPQEEPVSPSMPKLQSIDFSIKEALRMSMKYLTLEDRKRYKEEVKEKYGFDDL